MSKSGVEAYIYLDFYADEIYTEDEINKTSASHSGFVCG